MATSMLLFNTSLLSFLEENFPAFRSELQAILDDSSDQVGLSVVICLLVLSHP